MGADGDIRVHALIDSLTLGGAEMLLAEFATVARSARIDLSVGYLSGDGATPAAARLRARGIEPVLVPLTGLKDPAALPRVRRHLSLVRPDLVHTHLGYADILGGAAARSLRLPAVSTVHAAEWPIRGRAWAKTRLAAMTRRRCAQRVIAVSDSARASYLARGWDAPERVVTIHNGIAGKAEPGAGRRVRAELGLDPKHLVVAVIAAMRPEKGHHLAAAACRRLVDRFPQLRLLVVGDGYHMAEVRRLMAPLGERAVIAGHREDVMAVVDAADVVLQPSLTDAFPTALLEAMAASTPVVATGVGGIPEIVEHGVTGALVPPPLSVDTVADVLAELLGDAELRARLGRGGLHRFREAFSPELWARRTREIYEAVLSA